MNTQKRFKNREIAEKYFKYTAAKTRTIKSENQVKGKVKAKTINKQYLPYLQLETFFKISVVPVPFDVDCPELLRNSLHRPGFVLLNMDVKNSVNKTIRKKSG
jgi:hypothetical protein